MGVVLPDGPARVLDLVGVGRPGVDEDEDDDRETADELRWPGVPEDIRHTRGVPGAALEAESHG